MKRIASNKNKQHLFTMTLFSTILMIIIAIPTNSLSTQQLMHQNDFSLSIPLGALQPPQEMGHDNDFDGIGDGLERSLLSTYAPVVLLWDEVANPTGLCEIDGIAWPCNVDWFLERSHMRFHHDTCPDCEIISHGGPTQSNIIIQEHRKKHPLAYWPPWDACDHYNDWERSWIDFDTDQCFFLQVYDGTHTGSSNPADWIVYGHVYPNIFSGISIQYWFFFAYNDGYNCHEGDWEHIVVELNEYLMVQDVIFCHHGDYDQIGPLDVTWYDGTHPVVISAAGSHGSYHSYDACTDALEPGCPWCIPVEECTNAWFTWSNGKPGGSPGFQGSGVVNVGEKDDPINGQTFIQYSGRWGEIGEFEWTSGSRGPAYHESGGESWYFNMGVLGANDPPYIPSNPTPMDGVTGVPIETLLSWTGGDPDGDSITYDIYFGTDNPPSKVVANQTGMTWNPGVLEFGTTYYWQIIAWDTYGLSAEGTIWSFSTRIQEVSPFESSVTFNPTSMPGLTTCPMGHEPGPPCGPVTLLLTIRDTYGIPIEGIPADAFDFIVSPTNNVNYYGILSCTFTPMDEETNGNGEIRFIILGNTSIQGNISIEVLVQDILFSDNIYLPCNSFDYYISETFPMDGDVGLQDFAMFASHWGTSNWESDFDWDEYVSLIDFAMFASHFGHQN